MFQRLPCMDDFCRKINVNDKISPAGTVAIDQFVNRLGEAMQAVKFGNPAERNDIAMGPLINAAALERVEQKVARSRRRGESGVGWQSGRGERILLSADIAAGCSPGYVDYA